jgi:hypothetical protein
MTINRSAPTPSFFEYVTTYALQPDAGSLPEQVSTLRPTPLRIPTFQRGISWGEEEVLQFLESDSALYGTVIIAMFPFVNSSDHVGQLVDGLQRFACGTALLRLLDPMVLSPTPTETLVAPHFEQLKRVVGGRLGVVEYNHEQLLTHQRRAIRDQYNEFFAAMTDFVRARTTPSEAEAFAHVITTVFLDKQVAIDNYFGFKGSVDLANTFIGLNTVRVDLGPVDLIRAFIIDNAAGQQPPWSVSDVADVENELTDAFTDAGSPRRDLIPTATAVLKCLERAESLRPTDAFPNWERLTKADVDTFREFTQLMIASTNSYVVEVRECGSLPFALVLLHYYRQRMKTGTTPSFLQGGSAEDDELHLFLRASYRRVINGTVGQLGNVAVDVLRGRHDSLAQVADAAARDIGSGLLSKDPGKDWLRTNLVTANATKAKRVFNACLLPPRRAKASFAPLTFGKRQDDWHVDHLIPSKQLRQNRPGHHEGDRLQNFAPLPSPFNRVASNTPCSEKLGRRGVYRNVVDAHDHPYLEWLLAEQSRLGGRLDDQKLLERNAATPIGDRRIDALVDLLAARV